MSYTKILFQDSPSTATPLNAQNLNHMDDQIAENDRRLNELATAGVVNTFNGRTGNVTSEKGDYDINQIVASDGQDGYIPVWRNSGTEQEPDWGFAMEEMGGSGHEILDADGTLMAQEDALQFADAFLTDDSVNGRTIVENIKEVDPADYASTTDEGIIVTDDGDDALIGPVSDDYVEVEADGVKTYGALLSELYTLSDTTKITQYSILKIGTFVLHISDIDFGAGTYRFERINSLTTSYMVIEQLGFKSSPYYRTATSTTSGNSFSDTLVNGVPSSGTKLTLYYGNKKATVDLQTTANRCVTSDGGNVQQKLNTNELTVTPVNGTIQAGSVKRKDNLVVINLRYVSTSASAVGDTIATLPYNITSSTAHVQLCNNKNYAIDLLSNKIRTNSAIASGETIIISGTVFVE